MCEFSFFSPALGRRYRLLHDVFIFLIFLFSKRGFFSTPYVMGIFLPLYTSLFSTVNNIYGEINKYTIMTFVCFTLTTQRQIFLVRKKS
jgi:hypothetical protein